jgi:hypothetical protein
MKRGPDPIAMEAMIDSYGIDQVLDVIGTICAEKSEYIATSWQDEPLAERWRLIAERINQVEGL